MTRERPEMTRDDPRLGGLRGEQAPLASPAEGVASVLVLGNGTSALADELAARYGEIWGDLGRCAGRRASRLAPCLNRIEETNLSLSLSRQARRSQKRPEAADAGYLWAGGRAGRRVRRPPGPGARARPLSMPHRSHRTHPSLSLSLSLSLCLQPSRLWQAGCRAVRPVRVLASDVSSSLVWSMRLRSMRLRRRALLRTASLHTSRSEQLDAVAEPSSRGVGRR